MTAVPPQPAEAAARAPAIARLRPTARKASTLVSVSYANMLEYRAEIFLWMLSGVVPLVLMGVWVQASKGGGFGGWQPVDFARYFLAVFVVRQLSTVWVIWEFEHEVVEGRLSPYLLQPLDPVWRHFAGHLGAHLTRIPLLLPMVVLFFLLYPAALWRPGVANVLFAAIAVAMAFLLRFVMQYTFAMLAFWTERASAIDGIWFLFYMFLSGMIAPLDVYPAPVRAAAQLTPFPYVVSFPARLVVGRETQPWTGFAVMLAWTAVFFVLNRLLWRRGLRRYSGMGA